MKVFVIGAGGNVGRLVVDHLRNANDEVTAGAHRQEQVDDFRKQSVNAEVFDLLKQPEEMAQQLQGYDAIVFSAGSGGKTGDDMTMLVDLDGAVKSMQAAELAGVKRFVMVSAIFAEDRTKWVTIKPYYAAKFYADEWLRHRTSLNYTILEPGGLTFEKETGKVTTDVPQAGGSISRGDVAAAVTASLHDDSSIGKIIPLINGQTSVKTAINQAK
ncbi:NAD(P)H-binding protein [Ligilactobacillus pobuzihii]|uniref:SDR family oxidoreductase n=1 Tax=Ligilactobacillus pobuzihii TaxID=449659 RepID=UPI0019D2DFA6|nr:SDR family oxidoreductase [Ligilactobacillus pobuzihii]MBN7274045.1 NAD(P)H-binding protein [Ligilactobacillus pobuzihii]